MTNHLALIERLELVSALDHLDRVISSTGRPEPTPEQLAAIARLRAAQHYINLVLIIDNYAQETTR
jgi:hypothetical protein